MKSNEFLLERNEYNLRGLTFSGLGKKRATIYMGEFTNVIGDFYDSKNIVVENPGFTSIVTIKSDSAPDIKEARRAFDKFFNVSLTRGVSQSQFGFKFSVDDLTPEDYADLLEKTYHFLTLTSR